jgi:hypothetical protein
MQQIEINLLSNAVKFTEPGGTITLSSEMAGSCVEIHVADTGAGIAPEKIARIFDPFVQVDRRLNQPVQGVGLGLAISQDLAQAMGGQVTAESVLGKGSTFTLSLPRAPRMELADMPAPAEIELADLPPASELADFPPASELADRAPHERPDPQRPKQRSDEDERRYHDA